MLTLRVLWRNGLYKKNITTTRRTPRRNRHSEKTTFCVFRNILFLLNTCFHTFLNCFSKKCWVTALVRSMTFIWGLNHVAVNIVCCFSWKVNVLPSDQKEMAWNWIKIKCFFVRLIWPNQTLCYLNPTSCL